MHSKRVEQEAGSLSVLGALARHERKLVVARCDAERSAQARVAAAREQAAGILRDAERALQEELVGLRQAAAGAVAQYRLGQAGDSQARLDQLRGAAAEAAGAIVEEIAALVLPAGSSRVQEPRA